MSNIPALTSSVNSQVEFIPDEVLDRLHLFRFVGTALEPLVNRTIDVSKMEPIVDAGTWRIIFNHLNPKELFRLFVSAKGWSATFEVLPWRTEYLLLEKMDGLVDFLGTAASRAKYPISKMDVRDFCHILLLTDALTKRSFHSITCPSVNLINHADLDRLLASSPEFLSQVERLELFAPFLNATDFIKISKAIPFLKELSLQGEGPDNRVLVDLTNLPENTFAHLEKLELKQLISFTLSSYKALLCAIPRLKMMEGNPNIPDCPLKDIFNCVSAVAAQGFSVAEMQLGIFFGTGFGVSKDEKHAVEWYEKAALKGLISALVQLGICYRDGIGVEMDIQKAIGYYQRAIEYGLPVAQNNLGKCYLDGNGVAQDFTKAIVLFQRAAKQNYNIAQHNLGVVYHDGLGVSVDFKKAAEWFQQAANQGNADSQYNLAHCYYFGNGVDQSFTLAFQWFQRAAFQGLACAQFNLGVCYLNGEGIPENETEARKWFQAAADQGNEDAIEALAELE